MKKILSFVLALALLLSVGVTAFADETPPAPPEVPLTNLPGDIWINPENPTAANGGTITISNATVGKVYTIYKIFAAEVVSDKNIADKDGVTYTVDPTSAAYGVLFPANPAPDAKQYFKFDTTSHQVSLIDEQTNSADLVSYFQSIVKANPDKFPHTSKLANGTTVTFEGLQYGYYLISCNLDAAATLDSNTPSVEVIDKSQQPGELIKQLKKKGQPEEWYANNENTVTGIDSNTVNIGDVVSYRISFDATNYAGQGKIQYYEVIDTKGTGIWAEFNSFTVKVNDESLPGYYLCNGGENTNNWADLGNWGNTPEADRKIEDAKWYLVHTGFDSYSILIPWMEGHTVTSAGKVGSVTVPTDDDFLYNTGEPVKVVIEYTAAIEPNAYIGTSGTGTGANLFNNAHLTWSVNNLITTQKTDSVYSETFGLTLLKTDFSDQSKVLEGATFALTDATGNPINVLPTGVDGVYMVDCAGKEAENVSGTFMDTAREYFLNLKDPDGNDIKVVGDDGQTLEKITNTELAELIAKTAVDGEGNPIPFTTNEVVTPKKR